MKRKIKSVLSLLLAAVMIFGSVAVGLTDIEFPDLGKLFAQKAEAAETSGTCGENLTWTFDQSTGTLTISGTGEMYDYSTDYAPWHDFRSEIETLIIEDGVTSIGFCAFADCYNLINLVISKTTERICGMAFYGCTSLRGLDLPASVNQIDNFAFTKAGLSYISVDYDNEVFADDGYSLLNKDKTELFVHAINNHLTRYEIPDSVEVIHPFAFAYSNLDEIEIPNGVTTIETGVWGCSSNLDSVIIPKSVIQIKEEAFYECKELKDIYYYGTKEEWNQIYVETEFNESLIDATIHYNYTSYSCGDNATWSYDADTGELVISGTGEMYSYNEYHAPWDDFREDIKSVIIEEGITSIGNYAFSWCHYIEKIELPDSLTTIGNSAFLRCIYIDPDIPDSVTTIGHGAFTRCNGITKLVIPDSVKSVGLGAFFQCNNLTDITIGKGVETFCGYEYDEDIYSVDLGVFGEYAFGYCPKIEKITVDNQNKNYLSEDNVLFSKDKTKIITYPAASTRTSYDIPEGVTKIEPYAFMLSANLTSVTIPKTVEEIGFLSFGETGLENVTFSYGVTQIGAGAFMSCQNLESITISSGLSYVGMESFNGCSKFSTIYYYGTEKQWNQIFVDSYNEYFNNAEVKFLSEVTIGIPFIYVIGEGKSAVLTATVLPENEFDYTIEWLSNNEDVVTVDSNGKITAVSGGSTSVKATIKETGASDSCIVLVIPKVFYGDFDFSEINMASNLSSSDPEGFDRLCDGGGNSVMATAYLARWDGTVLEERDPYPTGGMTYGYTEIDADYHVQEVLWLPNRTGPLDNNTIKQAIIEYGAIYASFLVNSRCFDNSSTNYYKPESMDGDRGGHAIAIVGWDDNYSKNNFVYKPRGNGAFICKNSWGTDSGDDGYFYISYYDSEIGYQGTMSVFNNLESPLNYNKIYQYDPLGTIGSLSYDDEIWGANVFPEKGKTLENNEELCAVSFYTGDKKTSYEVYVVKDYSGVSDLYNNRMLVDSGTIDYAGYHTVEFDPVVLEKDTRFAVVVKIIEKDGDSSLYCEYPLEDYSSKARANSGESYYASNGKVWYDMIKMKANTNVCIKAFTDTITNTEVYMSAIDNENRENESDKVYSLEEAVESGFDVSQEFVDYRNSNVSMYSLEDTDFATGEIPSPVEIGNNDVSFASGIRFPSYYNLVDEDCVTSVKNQGYLGTCWTFASYASLESCLLKKGKKTISQSDGMTSREEIDAIVNSSVSKLESLEFDESSKELLVGEKYQLIVKSSPVNVEIPDVIWKSSDENVVAVNENGLIEAKSYGVAVVTATTYDQKYVVSCIISVVDDIYKVTWIVDGEIISQSYEVGEGIVKPADPEKEGYRFVGWTPDVPSTMPANDLTFIAVFEPVSESIINTEIRRPSTTTISYGDSIILHADVEGELPAGYTVKWTADNGNFSYKADGATCTISPEKSGDTTFTATIYDADGNAVSTDEQTMTSNAGFFQKIIAFFKKLFGLTKTIPDIFKF